MDIDPKVKKLLETLKDKDVGVFCDDSNLYHAYKKYGWRVDFEKLKNLLKSYCNLKFIHYHLAIPDKSDDAFRGTKNFLLKIESYVDLKKKLLKYTPIAGKFMKKADVDVEITLDVVRNIENLDVVIIMSGDSDFYELHNYVIKDKKKNIIFVGYEENMAWELRQCWHIYVNRIKDMIEFRK